MTYTPPIYLDSCATTPPASEVLEAMAAVHAEAWANPSSLHGFGLAAAEWLERSRQRIAEILGCGGNQVIVTSGGTESIHMALLGAAADGPPGRLLISAVEHPATVAAAGQLAQRGWQVETLPVDHLGVVDLDALDRLLAPPTRLVSLIWGQSEVGTVQPIERIGRRCREAGVLLHVDAVQVVGHLPLAFDALPIDLLSFASHKLQGPRGVGALLVRPDLALKPFIGGGGQEAGRRGGTEPVALVAGLARALDLCDARLRAHGGRDPIADLRNDLLQRLLQLPAVRLSGPDPFDPSGPERLPHHISLLMASPSGRPISGRRLVQTIWQQGYAVSSGSACSSGRGANPWGLAPSPILQAMGYPDGEAASGLRISLGPWLTPADLEGVPGAVERGRLRVIAGEPVG
ncbi:cysteine desulfurase family protein [Vulcanococcus limneticus]|uniref:cysteine desulfurase family protein n=1 Tax=Vulcanococcus limneticus TaxID=2170428 RepID=UPI00398BDC0A